MRLFRRKPVPVPPHTRRAADYPGALSARALRDLLGGDADFAARELWLGGDPEKPAALFWLDGMTQGEKLAGELLRPLSEDPRLKQAQSPEETVQLLLRGGLWCAAVRRVDTLDGAARALMGGSAVLIPDGAAFGLACMVRTEERRSVEAPENEKVTKGSREAFSEELRVNTALVRKRLRTPRLRIAEETVGRESLTPVDVLYVDGLTDPTLVAEVRRRLEKIDTDELFAAAWLEEYLIDQRTIFPLILTTERTDKLCSHLMEGRVGLLADGLPTAYILPVTLPQFLRAMQDDASRPLMSSVLRVLRYLSVLVTLLLPAFYTAVATFHQEMIPTRFALSIIASKQDVPFVTTIEVLIMLLAFEILQEAGLRLPQNIGQTVSIIGGLVVGQAAVDAKIVSPVVLIVVAAAGITGYTMPNQDFANALRLWRFLICVAAALMGLFGITIAMAVMLYRLASLETFGVPYLTPLAGPLRRPGRDSALLRLPVRQVKLRDSALHPQNERSQR